MDEDHETKQGTVSIKSLVSNVTISCSHCGREVKVNDRQEAYAWVSLHYKENHMDKLPDI